jgi:hydroxymethylglutaryl-CoA synthase
VLAAHLGGASATEEFLDRWRAPGDVRSKVWEERFGETAYVPLGERAWNDALKSAEITPEQIDRVVVTGTHARAVRQLAGRLGTPKEALVDDLSATVGNTGTAHPGMLLASALEGARPGQVVALVVLADGADVLVFRAGDAVSSFTPARAVAAQVQTGGSIPYGKFLSWRGLLPVEPPRRPEPERTSASAAARAEEWKFAFVGSRDRSSGAIHLPPARISMKGDAVDDMEPVPMADVPATVVTFTVDRLVYSPSPPVVFAVLDFDGGGRFACELTDVDADELSIGDRVEMTFRRLSTADGIHNYFWKARPIRIPRS